VPEGDTVWLACQRLNRALAGHTLTGSQFRVPQYASLDLAGVTVRQVASRGKHQLFRFDNEHTLHTHLRMDGSWHLYSPDAKPHGGPDYQIRVVLHTATTKAIGYRLPVIEYLPTAEEHTVVGHLGPDLLGPDWDAEEALRRLRADPTRSIGEALLDQRNLAGIGTLYRAETLFLSGVHPRTPVGQVKDLERVVDRARRLLEANKERPEQVTTGDARRGREQWVFNRERQPCRRCRTPIRVEEFGPAGQERRSFWCPRCQPHSSDRRHGG
jgi:endonuclease-8